MSSQKRLKVKFRKTEPFRNETGWLGKAGRVVLGLCPEGETRGGRLVLKFIGSDGRRGG